MNNSPDVIIVGGGIMGGSVAYHLAKLGIKPVILERESIGCEASGVASGMISVMSIDSPGPYLDLRKQVRIRAAACVHAIPPQNDDLADSPAREG